VASVAEFVVPPLEDDGDWPSLGSQVVDWQESMLVFGPGDLLGKPYRLDDEDRALSSGPTRSTRPSTRTRFDVDFERHRGPLALLGRNGKCGRRRFDTIVVMTRKGTLKSERLAATGAVELSEDGPVRCDGFRRSGKRLGARSADPSLAVVSPLRVRQGAGRGHQLGRDAQDDRARARRRTSSTSGRSGSSAATATARRRRWRRRPIRATAARRRSRARRRAHRWTLPRHKEAHQTTRGNLSKRPIAEPWEMHATTMYAPGEGSVLEEIHDAAKKLTGEAAKASRMFFFYRWADDVWGLYVNPAGWESVAARWAATYGDEVVKAWWTNRWTEVSRATRAYQAAIASSGVTHSGAPELVRAIGAAHRFYLTTRDEDGKPIWVIRKERADSPHPVNLAHAALMSWQARLDALKAGAAQPLQWTVA
jgi:hypothetical protein